MFDGFQLDRVDVGEVTLRVRHGGEGQPVVLLHGHPRTHTTWHRVAPRLSSSFSVVCPDLRGYGQSTLPPDCRELADICHCRNRTSTGKGADDRGQGHHRSVDVA